MPSSEEFWRNLQPNSERRVLRDGIAFGDGLSSALRASSVGTRLGRGSAFLVRARCVIAGER